MASISPMMKQYLEIKEKHKDCLVFFRLGDFYELFFEDAKTASRELGLTLTGRDCAQEERAPMCGVPHHAAKGYIEKLIEKGYRVAICEQMENPKDVKGIVKRDVVRIVTAGTLIDDNPSDSTKNNYVMTIVEHKLGFGIAVCDVSTGDFITTKVEPANFKKLCDEIARFLPKEIVVNEIFSHKEEIYKIFDVTTYFYNNWVFDFTLAKNKLLSHFNIHTLTKFGIENDVLEISACGGLIEYLYSTQKNSLKHISKIKNDNTTDFMLLDMSSRRNLELTETIRDRNKKGSLLWVINKTLTPAGARLVRSYLEKPLIDANKIVNRLDAVEYFFKNYNVRSELREILSNIFDVERIIGKVIYGTVNGRDLVSLKKSIEFFPKIKGLIKNTDTILLDSCYENLFNHSEIFNLINTAIQNDPPVTITDGDLICQGYNSELDQYRNVKNSGTDWLLKIENEEREKTGIKNLKIKYNKIFGYYIEVTNSYLKLVPENYIRRQTMANGERYITEELKEIEEKILGADEKITELEYTIFKEIVSKILAESDNIKKSIEQISIIDVCTSFAVIAEKNNYVRPIINTDGIIDIKEGRHPVIELISSETFIPNDTYLDNENDRFSMITGPNMAGKSTYMRQVALITILAQIGSFVPCKKADISVVDRIFTRVGASDDLATGQSTFMIEMSEVANILNSATKNSLLILDEIGRGTSTYDGLSIAWSITEYIADKKLLGAKTLFATHYHELTELDGIIEGIKNYCVTIAEKGDDIVFLRKVARGFIDHSYGIHVAKIAGIPSNLITRSKEILQTLELKENTKVKKYTSGNDSYDTKGYKLNSDKYKIMLKELEDIDMDGISFRDAYKILYTLKDKAK